MSVVGFIDGDTVGPIDGDLVGVFDGSLVGDAVFADGAQDGLPVLLCVVYSTN